MCFPWKWDVEANNYVFIIRQWIKPSRLCKQVVCAKTFLDMHIKCMVLDSKQGQIWWQCHYSDMCIQENYFHSLNAMPLLWRVSCVFPDTAVIELSWSSNQFA